VKADLRESLLRTTWGYGAYMSVRWGSGKRALPAPGRMNCGLKTQAEVDAAVAEAARLRLPPCGDPAKTWDTLGALREVLTRTTPDARILDAGAELYSRLLPWLYLYGYRNLLGNNLVFEGELRQGPIRYEQGDITKTRFEAASFDAISCLSVIEHGVDLDAYFREMARVLKPGGVLVTSTDYFETATDTRGLAAYGVPIHVFTKPEILEAVEIAKRHDLHLTGPLDPASQDRVVHWTVHDLRYSFIAFAMTRGAGR
jgi:SAM-dependent methyltransferase